MNFHRRMNNLIQFTVLKAILDGQKNPFLQQIFGCIFRFHHKILRQEVL